MQVRGIFCAVARKRVVFDYPLEFFQFFHDYWHSKTECIGNCVRNFVFQFLRVCFFALKNHIAALDVCPGVGKTELGKQLAQGIHFNHAVAAHIDAPQN